MHVEIGAEVKPPATFELDCENAVEELWSEIDYPKSLLLKLVECGDRVSERWGTLAPHEARDRLADLLREKAVESMLEPAADIRRSLNAMETVHASSIDDVATASKRVQAAEELRPRI